MGLGGAMMGWLGGVRSGEKIRDIREKTIQIQMRGILILLVF
jgi:hypothetical protein